MALRAMLATGHDKASGQKALRGAALRRNHPAADDNFGEARGEEVSLELQVTRLQHQVLKLLQ